MGHGLVRGSCDQGGEAAKFPVASPATPGTQRHQLEDLTAMVDEVRQENQQLHQQTSSLRDAIADARSGGGVPPSDLERLQDEEMLRLKRMLLDLQHENIQLEQTAKRRVPAAGGTVSYRDYQALQRQVADLERAHDTAAAQTQRLRQQQQQQLQHQQQQQQFSTGMYWHTPKNGSLPTSGTATPLAAYASVEDMRSKVIAMHAENDSLKKKIRMLAAV
mmetsp:Transcript_75420/g.213203  ORF Transcript_75420/g.213203 Transcript_75420/m.213203 type:complete len:219 (+) Transcript_75420:88-744(+)